MRSGRLFVLLAALCSSGCVTIAHEADWFSWWHEESRTQTEVKSVVVTSEPAGAQVSRSQAGAAATPIGVTPFVDNVTLTREERIKTPKTGALWIGAALQFAGGFALMISGVSSAANDSDVGAFFGLAVPGSLLVTSGMIDALAAFIHGSRSPETVHTRADQTFVYNAQAPGRQDAAMVARLPEQSTVHLVLGGSPLAPKISDRGWIVAVMSMDEVADSPKEITPAGMLASLGDQIRVLVARRGIRTVDRGAQEAMLAQQIVQMKNESYKTCYDSSCQIELGKALAASHILRTRLTRFGKRCVLTGELIELRTEVTVAAASTQGTCEGESLLEMSEALAKELIEGA